VDFSAAPVGEELTSGAVAAPSQLSADGPFVADPESCLMVTDVDVVLLDAGRVESALAIGPDPTGGFTAEEFGELDMPGMGESGGEAVRQLGVGVGSTTGAPGRGSGTSCAAARAPPPPSTHTTQAAAVARTRRRRRMPRALMRATGTGTSRPRTSAARLRAKAKAKSWPGSRGSLGSDTVILLELGIGQRGSEGGACPREIGLDRAGRNAGLGGDLLDSEVTDVVQDGDPALSFG